MKFETMLGYWKIRGNMIKHQSCLTNDAVANNGERHCTWHMVVTNGSMYANIIYKFTIKNGVKCNYALIHADILFSGFMDIQEIGKVFRKNVKVSDLCNEFVG